MTFARRLKRRALKEQADTIRVTKAGRVYLVPRNAMTADYVQRIDRGYGPDLVLAGKIRDAGMVQ